MITRRSLVGMATWTVAAAGLKAAPGKSAEKKALSDHEQIDAGIQSFVAAYNAGNLQKLMSHYAEDLVKCRQGGATDTKKDTAARNFQVFQNFTGEISVTTEEIETSGDMAYTRGSYKAVLTPRQGGGKATVIERRFLEILRKQNGEWLITRTMDNAAPRPGPRSPNPEATPGPTP
jgi:ketosteroid isomerase-like protein